METARRSANGIPSRKLVLLIGDSEHDEFTDGLAWLSERANVARFASPAEALRRVDANRSPEIVLWVQAWPGRWSESAIDDVHRRWPLARLVALLGSWSEGEGRTGQPRRGVTRIHWCDLVWRLSPFLAENAGAPPASWNLSRTATDMERLTSDLKMRDSRSGLVVIGARTWHAYETLSDACRCVGYSTVWQRPDGATGAPGALIGIWDAAVDDSTEWRGVADFVRGIEPATVLVIVGFPRFEDRMRAKEHGAVVLAKPFRLPDLWQALRRIERAAGTIGMTRGMT